MSYYRIKVNSANRISAQSISLKDDSDDKPQNIAEKNCSCRQRDLGKNTLLLRSLLDDDTGHKGLHQGLRERIQMCLRHCNSQSQLLCTAPRHWWSCSGHPAAGSRPEAVGVWKYRCVSLPSSTVRSHWELGNGSR